MFSVSEFLISGQHDHTNEFILTHFEIVSVLSSYIATYDTRSFLLLYPNFHVFSIHKCLTIEDTRSHDDALFGVILLDNNKKSDESIFLFDESIFILPN